MNFPDDVQLFRQCVPVFFLVISIISTYISYKLLCECDIKKPEDKAIGTLFFLFMTISFIFIFVCAFFTMHAWLAPTNYIETFYG